MPTPARRPRRGARRARPGAGQATVELAFVLPAVVLLLLLLVQGALVVRDQVLTVNAAREAAREASVGSPRARVLAAAGRVLGGAQVEIERAARVGEPVRVRVTFVSRTDVPLVGPLLPDVELRSTATMRAER